MAREFDGATDRIDFANPWNPQGSAITMAMWVYNPNNTNTGYISHIHQAGDAGPGIAIRKDGGAGSISVFRAGDTPKERESNDGQYATGVWSHFAWTDPSNDFGDGTEITIYVNGSEVSGYDVTGNGVNEWSFGGSHSLGGRIYDDNRNFEGYLADVAHWNRVLSDAELGILAAGYSPLCIPRGLMTYQNLVRTAQCIITGASGSLDGTGVASHPPVIYPAPPLASSKGIIGLDVCWGHDTAVTEDNIRNFFGNWTGTGEIVNAGVNDTEAIELEGGEYMISEVVYTGTIDVEITYNQYAAGDAINLDYRHGATSAACQAAAWNDYAGSFTSAGYVQVKVTHT